MDITDGFLQSVTELGAASGVGFEIDVARIPLHTATRAVAQALGVDPIDFVAGMGLDLELLGTLDGDGGPPEATILGDAVDGPSALLVDGERRPLKVDGWAHFGVSALDRVRRLVRNADPGARPGV